MMTHYSSRLEKRYLLMAAFFVSLINLNPFGSNLAQADGGGCAFIDPSCPAFTVDPVTCKPKLKDNCKETYRFVGPQFQLVYVCQVPVPFQPGAYREFIYPEKSCKKPNDGGATGGGGNGGGGNGGGGNGGGGNGGGGNGGGGNGGGACTAQACGPGLIKDESCSCVPNPNNPPNVVCTKVNFDPNSKWSCRKFIWMISN